MSLLTNPWFNVGMGLLANSGPSLSPVNPWRGIGQGLMAANEAKVMEAEQQYRQQMMLRQQQEYEQEAKREEMMQQWAQTQKDPALAALFPQQAAEAALRAPEGPNLPAGWMMGPDGQAMMIPGYKPEEKPQTAGIEMQRGDQVYTARDVNEANQLAQQGWSYYRPPPTTVINNGPDLPSGYMWKDPNNKAAGVAPIPDGPASKPTEAQSLAGGFAERMSEAAASIDALEGDGYDPSTFGATMTPDLLAKPETRQYRQAQRDWVRAKLRKESGASIGEKEMEDEIKTYFPQPGDDAKTIEQKRRARITAERAMYKQAGPAAPGTQPTATPEAPAPTGKSVFEKYPDLLRPPQ